jgi:uncharacterized protein (UPF0335 family)
MSAQTEPAQSLDAIVSRIESMEAELAELKEQVRQLQGPKPVRTFGDLRGIFRGQMDVSEEEIDAALYRVDASDEDA